MFSLNPSLHSLKHLNWKLIAGSSKLKNLPPFLYAQNLYALSGNKALP